MKTVYSLGGSPQFRLPCVKKGYIKIKKEEGDMSSNFYHTKKYRNHHLYNEEEDEKLLSIDQMINKNSKIKSLKYCIDINPLMKSTLRQFYKQFHQKIIKGRNSRKLLEKHKSDKKLIKIKKTNNNNVTDNLEEDDDFSSFTNMLNKININKYYDDFDKYPDLEKDSNKSYEQIEKMFMKNKEQNSQTLNPSKEKTLNSTRKTKKSNEICVFNNYFFPISNCSNYFDKLYKTQSNKSIISNINKNKITIKRNLQSQNIMSNLIISEKIKNSKSPNKKSTNKKDTDSENRNSLENIKINNNEKNGNSFSNTKNKNYGYGFRAKGKNSINSPENKLNIIYCENDEQFDRIYERYKKKNKLKGLGLTHISCSPKVIEKKLNQKINIIKNKIGLVKSIVDYTYPKIFFSKIAAKSSGSKFINSKYNSPYKEKLINLKKIQILEDQYYSIPLEIINKNKKSKGK